MAERKMAWVVKIDSVVKHPDADSLDICTVGGWKCVTKLGEFKEGDLAVYLSIDSWVPTALAPFLTKVGHEPKVCEGIQGERLRTVKLRKQISQGLLISLDTALPFTNSFVEGDDVSEVLGVIKWERPMNAQLAGMAKGNFPSIIPKTDQERVQNLKKEIEAAAQASMIFEVTEKMEGSSMTCYLIDGVFGTCSRNLDLKETLDNTFWQVARTEDIEAKMLACGPGNWAIQGELIGPGIQDNIYKLSKPEFRVFDVYDIQTGKYLPPAARHDLIQRMGLKHVPVVAMDKDLGIGTVDELLSWAEGKSVLNPAQEREGIVFKQVDGGMTFKAVSNSYLLKTGG